MSIETRIQSSTTSYKYAVVTGANKGIGLETVRQLAKAGVTVVLTSRDVKRGASAHSSLRKSDFSNVLFHQLDVLDPISVQSFASFIQTTFGRLDILVNNAATSGVEVDGERLRAMNVDPTTWLSGGAVDIIQEVVKTTYEKAEECVNTNYFGLKHVTEALLPLLKVSPQGGRIVNLSSLRGELRRIRNEGLRRMLEDVDTLTVEKLDGVIRAFLLDLRDGVLVEKGWSLMLPAYSISKAVLNAYTRLMERNYPEMCINCVHPGYVDTDINWHTGPMTVTEGAKGPVMAALLPDGGVTGCYFDQTQVAEF